MLYSTYFIYRNPTPNEDSNLGIPIWPTLEPHRMQYLDIDNVLTIRDDLTRYKAMEEIYEAYFKPPYNVY